MNIYILDEFYVYGVSNLPRTLANVRRAVRLARRGAGCGLALRFYDAVQRSARLPWWQAADHPDPHPPENPMADIHIDRAHTLGLPEARQIACQWAEQAKAKFGMECTYEEGPTRDLVSFSRTGVHGTLSVTQDGFELQAKLGFLLGAFKEKIEAEIVRNLESLMATKAA